MSFQTNKVSIVMAVYNDCEYINQNIESVLNQSHKEWEYIIVNDGSTDITPQLLQNYAEIDKRIRIINQRNVGQTRALNNGLNYVSGEYIARIDADDTMSPNRLEKQVQYLNDHPEIGLTGSSVSYHDESDNHFFTLTPPTSHEDLVKHLIRRNPFVHSTIMFRYEIIKTVGKYDENLKAAQDYNYWMRISRQYRVSNIPDVLVTIKKHNKSISARHYRLQAFGRLKTQAMAISKGWYSPFKIPFMYRSVFHLLLPRTIHDKWLLFRKKRQTRSNVGSF